LAAPVAATFVLSVGAGVPGAPALGSPVVGASGTRLLATVGRAGVAAAAVVEAGDGVDGGGESVVAGMATGSGEDDAGAGSAWVDDEGTVVTGVPVTVSPDDVAGIDAAGCAGAAAGADTGAALATAVPVKRKPLGHELYSCETTPFFVLPENDACSPTASIVTRPPPAAVITPACTAAVQIDESSV
jgi:hypothetical protein